MITNIKDSYEINLFKQIDRKELYNFLFEMYVIEKLHPKQIAKIFNTSTKNINVNLKIFKIPIRDQKERWDIELGLRKHFLIDKFKKQIILGGLLGDGSLTFGGGRNAYYIERHCKKQKGYMDWKCKIFGVKSKKICYYEKRDNCNGYSGRRGWFKQYQMKLPSEPYFTRLYKYFYKDHKKIILPEVLNELDATGLAVWFMDDGSKIVRRKNIAFSIHHKFIDNKEENYVRNFFKNKFNIKCYIIHRKTCDSIMIARKEEALKFLNLVKPIVSKISCMNYKITL